MADQNLKAVKGSNYQYDMPSSKGDKCMPSFSINDTDLPAINGWKVGQTYELRIQVKMTGISEAGDHMKPQGNIGQFEITAIAPYQETLNEQRQRLQKEAADSES